MAFFHQLSPGSSSTDWCEQNYIVSSFIAEFYNTISNAIFLVMPPLLVHLFRPYTAHYGANPNLVWGLLVLVGLGSIYFHATLSHVGQLIDELAILWVIIASYATWWPTRFLPFGATRSLFKTSMLAISLMFSMVGCYIPAVNKYALMLFAFPIIVVMILEVQRVKDDKISNLAFRCLFMWLLAMTCWISDKFFCIPSFPYLHSAWHIFIFITAYTAAVLYSYFFAVAEIPNEKPILRYWPCEQLSMIGVPYVALGKTKKLCEA